MARLTSTGILFNVADTTNFVNSFYWIYPAGTQKVFYQAAAPTGWTKSIAQNNKALRVVSGTGGGSGGITNFTTALSGSSSNLSLSVNNTFPVGVVPGTGQNVGNTTLALSQLPNHTHVGLTGGVGGSGATPFSFGGNFIFQGAQETGGMIQNTGGGSHTHPFSGSTTINDSRTYIVDLSVQYVDVIICSLD